MQYLQQETLLHEAMAKDEFILYYQPQVDLISENLVAVEALVRWQHPEKGLILPGEFIKVAEETGLIIPVSDWVLQTACQQLKDWNGQGISSSLTMAVNCSIRQSSRAARCGPSWAYRQAAEAK